MSNLIPVAIVGGGPCGLFTALLLARKGVACALYEKNTGISNHPKAMGISRRTAEIYRQTGLCAALQAVALPLEGKDLLVWSKTLVGEELGRIPLAEFHSAFTPATPQHCPQTETERILLDALRNEPLAEIHFGREVTEVRIEEDGGEIRLADGDSCVFSWLVAADGAGSRLRKMLGIETSGPGDMGHFLNVMFRAPYGTLLQDRQALLYNTLWQNGFEGFVSINGYDLWLMHHFMDAGKQASDYSQEQLVEIIRGASGAPDLPIDILGVSPWVMSPKIANRFRKDRAFLVGDAAARLSPAGGLGLNTGLQSAHNLAWKLAAVVQGTAGEALLDTYHQERHGFSSSVFRSSNQNAGEIFAIVSEAVEGKWEEVRRLIANSRRNGSTLGLDLGFTYEQGAFVPDGTIYKSPEDPINDYVPSATPGRRAPHLPIQSLGYEQSTLDFFTGQFVLLACQSEAGWDACSDCACRVIIEKRDFQGEGFCKLYGIEPSGAVLVRPDGVVGARWRQAPENPREAVRAACDQILCK